MKKKLSQSEIEIQYSYNLLSSINDYKSFLLTNYTKYSHINTRIQVLEAVKEILNQEIYKHRESKPLLKFWSKE